MFSPGYEIEQDEDSLYSSSKPQRGIHKRDCAGCQGLTKESPAGHKEYKEAGKEPVLGENVGRPSKPYLQSEVDVIRAAHARYRFGARMLETVVRKQFTTPSYAAGFNITCPIWNNGCNDACRRNRHQIIEQCLEENQ